jgi:hypothetical protein
VVRLLQLPDHRDRDHFAGAHREGRSLGEVSMAERGNSPVASIFDGTDEIICESLDLCRQKLKQKTTCRKLSAALPAGFKAGIVSSLFKRIEDNWEQTKDNWEKSELKRLERDPSWESKNWQLRHQTEPAERSESLETLLERAIAILAKLGELPDEWYNQISVDSGLVDGGGGRHVDLAHMDGNDAELVELKWKSDTPLFALFEVLDYGLVLLLSRRNAEKLGYRDRDLKLIDALVVKLAVLAPSQYYDGYDCRKYAGVVNEGLRQLRDTHPDLPEMSFRFLRFPSWFDELPFKTGAEVNALWKVGDDDPRRVKLRDAMKALEPVIWDS